MSDTQSVAQSIIEYRTELIDLGSLGQIRFKRPMINPFRLRRRSLHAVAHAFSEVMTRTDVYGLENIPAQGPVLILPNHVSNLDGIMVLAHYPRQIEMVGPGDFKMVTLKDWMLRAYGIVPINRGRADTGNLKNIVGHLKAGRELLMFPGGGMWEKRHFEAKDGAAYFSQLTNTPILPVGISGAYLKTIDAFTGRRPRLTLRFGELMPAVPPSRNRRARDADLDAASVEIRDRIWDLMEPAEQAQFTHWEREVYHMEISFVDVATSESVAYDGPALPDMAALAEFVAKPNLFRPMWENAGLNLDIFREDRFFAPVELQLATRELSDLLHGEYDAYIPYRMGDDAAAEVTASLDALRNTVSRWAIDNHARVKLTSMSVDTELA